MCTQKVSKWASAHLKVYLGEEEAQPGLHALPEWILLPQVAGKEDQRRTGKSMSVNET